MCKNAKKILNCVIFASIILCSPKTISAAGFDDSNLTQSGDYNDVVALDTEILNYAYSTYNGEDPDIAEKEIMYDKAIKVYKNVELFSEGTMTVDELHSKISNADYQWTIPVYYCGETAMISVERGEELSDDDKEWLKNLIDEGALPEDEIEKRESLTGEMYISDAHFISYPEDYQQLVTDELNNNGIPIEETEIYFFRYTPGFHTVLAVIIRGEELYVISPHREIYLNNNVSRTTGTDTIESGRLLEFDVMSDSVVEDMSINITRNASGENVDTGSRGGTNSESGENLITLCIGAILLGGIGILWNRDRKTSK